MIRSLYLCSLLAIFDLTSFAQDISLDRIHDFKYYQILQVEFGAVNQVNWSPIDTLDDGTIISYYSIPRNEPGIMNYRFLNKENKLVRQVKYRLTLIEDSNKQSYSYNWCPIEQEFLFDDFGVLKKILNWDNGNLVSIEVIQ